jgi:hypothetical protein
MEISSNRRQDRVEQAGRLCHYCEDAVDVGSFWHLKVFFGPEAKPGVHVLRLVFDTAALRELRSANGGK